MTHPPPEAIGMNGFPCFPLSKCFSATSSPTFPQFSRHQVNTYVTLPGHLHHWQLREGSTGVAVLYHWRLGPMVGCGRLPNVMDRGFFEWFLRHATSSQQRVWSYEPSQTRCRGEVFFFWGQNHAKRLGWRNKLKQVYSRGMCNVASMH